MTPSQIDYIKELFPFINDTQIEQFKQLPALYTEWNEKINVISRKDIENIFTHHILHSLAIAKIVTFLPQSRVLDIGTGGGFPGIPLAILFPQTDFYLIDRIAKKIRVVNEIKQSLNLKNVVAEQISAEEIKSKYDFIVSRAVTNMKDFLPLCKNKIVKENKHKIKNGLLYLKGTDAYQDMIAFKDGHYKIYDLKDIFSDPFFETKCLVYISLNK